MKAEQKQDSFRFRMLLQGEPPSYHQALLIFDGLLVRRAMEDRDKLALECLETQLLHMFRDCYYQIETKGPENDSPIY